MIASLFEYAKRLFNHIEYFQFNKKYSIPKSFTFNGHGTHFYGDGEIKIGENSTIGRCGSVCAFEGYKVVIGDNTKISHFVAIYTRNKNPRNYKEMISADVIIGDNCWIGYGVYINQGITLGDNCVVGAGSVVTKSFLANSIIGGVPAKLISLK